MTNSEMVKSIVVFSMLCSSLYMGGCATRAPTIAHVHIGHAVTGARDTPREVGYFVLAEQRAQEALDAAERAASASDLEAIKGAVEDVNRATNTHADYALVAAVKEAADHIAFAAESSDASANVKESSLVFSSHIEGIAYRANLINLYATDVRDSDSIGAAEQLVAEIAKLARGNVMGEPDQADTRAYGVRQLRAELDAMIARENPPYQTVSSWYLFNLVRMPSGDWIFRRTGSGGGSSY